MTEITASQNRQMDRIQQNANEEIRESKSDVAQAKRDGAPSSEIRRLEAKVARVEEEFGVVVFMLDETLESQIEEQSALLSDLENDPNYSKLLHMSPRERLDFQRNDPKGFRESLSKLSPTDKQDVYIGIQNEVQSENRFWSMMTNLQQAEHDTSKQLIQNFRV